jgi:NADH-quinone oxidoreductase subunit L
MMTAIGAGVAGAGFLHLLTHGLFKALLFLGAGSVIHAVGSNDLPNMGGLAKRMPQTATVFIVGTLSLAGIPFFGGYVSKEEILGAVYGAHLTGPFALLMLVAGLTAFYMFRVVFLAFFGRPHDVHGHPHEAPPLMAVPLWILAGLTIGIGLRFVVHPPEGEHGPSWLAPLSLGLAAAGFVLAWATYQVRVVSAAMLAALFGPIDYLARRRYGLDALYAGLYRALILGFSRLVGWVDRYLVDGVLNVLSAWTLRGGDVLRRIQSGQPQDYVYGVAFGVLLLFVWAQFWR